MATFEELMAALRKADAAGDVEAAKAIARQAKAVQGTASPRLPAPDASSSFAAQVAPLMAPPSAPDAPPAMDPVSALARAMAPPPPRPVAQAPAAPLAPPPQVAAPQMAAPPMSVGDVARNLEQYFPGSGFADVMRGGPRMPPQAPGPQPADPFAGESFGDLAKRRGQQFAIGAGEVVASVPEALAILAAQAEAPRGQGASDTSAQRAPMIADMQAALADPAIPADQKALIQRNLADLMVGQGVMANQAAQPVVPAQDRPLFKAGDTARQAVKDAVGTPDPRDTGFWSQVAQGGGNMVGMIAASLAGGVAGGPVGALATGAASGASLNAPSLYKEAIKAGASEESARQAARWGAVIGASEIVPITRALKILPPRVRGELTTGMMRKFVDIAQSAGEEAAQEYLATVANNITAQQLFDPTRGWTEGATDAALVGAVLGGGVGAVGSALEGRSTPQAQDQQPAPTDQLAATMQPPRPAPAVAPAQPQQPDPVAQISAAMQGNGPDDVRRKQAVDRLFSGKKTITRAEVEANPDRFEIVDEAEGQGADWRATGAQVAIDKTTGRAIALAPETAAAPAAEGATGAGDSAGKPQAAPVQRVGDAPAAAGPAATGPAPSAPRRAGKPERRFLTNEETLSIETDAATFQYKSGGDETGVTDRLKGVTKFDPVRAGQAILFRTNDGRLKVADGHQRTGLAKRAAEAGQEDVGGMAALIYDESDGYSPRDVMAIAALKNIGEGSGTALDAARILRDTPETIEKLGLPPKSALVRDAEGLRKLSQIAFGMVANGKASERDGAVVGRVVQDQAVQADILALLTRINPPNAAQAEMIARDAASETATETQDDLFGSAQVEQSLYLERAKVMDGAVKELRKNKAAFNVLLKNGATIEGAGNKLDQDANAAQVQQDAMVLEYVQRQATMKGPISEALTAAARTVKAGGSVADARRAFVADTIRALTVSGAAGQNGAGGIGTNSRAPEPEAQAVEPERDDDAAAGDLFGGPPSAPAPDPQAQIAAAMTGPTPASPAQPPVTPASRPVTPASPASSRPEDVFATKGWQNVPITADTETGKKVKIKAGKLEAAISKRIADAEQLLRCLRG